MGTGVSRQTERGTGWRLHFQHQCRRRHRTEDQHPPGHQRQAVQLTAGSHPFQMTYAQLTLPHNRHPESHCGLVRPRLNRQPSPPCPPAGSFLAPGGHRHPVRWHSDSGRIVPRRNCQSRDRPISSLAKPNSTAKPSAPCSCGPCPFLKLVNWSTNRRVLRIDGTFSEGKLLRVDKETVTLSNILFGLKTLNAASTPWRLWSIPTPLIQNLHPTARRFHPLCPPIPVKEGHLHLPIICYKTTPSLSRPLPKSSTGIRPTM